MFKKAFTLAEVLITLTIIGVVAAVTVPAIISNAENKELIVAARKQYSAISNALNLYKAQNGGTLADMFPTSGDSNYSIKELSTLLKMNKICTTSQTCWTNPTSRLNQLGDQSGNFSLGALYYGKNQANAILADGARLTVQNNAPSIGVVKQCTNYNADGSMRLDADGNPVKTNCTFNNYAFMYIDVNGAKGPNRLGKDTWELRIFDNKINGCGWRDYSGCLETILQTDALVKERG